MDVAILFWQRMPSDVGLPNRIIFDRDPKISSKVSQGLHKLIGIKLQVATSYCPETDGLAERMIHSLQNMIRRYCDCGLV